MEDAASHIDRDIADPTAPGPEGGSDPDAVDPLLDPRVWLLPSDLEGR